MGIDTYKAAGLHVTKWLASKIRIIWPLTWAKIPRIYDVILHVAVFFSLITFIAFFIISNHELSIWFDESYSLWATNNNLSFRYLFSDILRHETNPPVYFVFLKLARLIYDQNIITGKFLNIFILFLSILFILKESSDKHLKNIFLYVILGSSASLAYAGEIRPLFSAICVAHVLSYFYIMAESREISRPFIKTITASILLSLIHVYGAIFAISIALAVALSGFLYKRNDLTKLSLTTLVFSFSAFLVWWIWINSTDRDALATVRWLSNDPMFIVAALKEGAGYIIGRGAISYAVALLAFVFFTLSKNIRISRLIFLSTLGLFFFLPNMHLYHFHGRRTFEDGRKLLESYAVGNGAVSVKYTFKYFPFFKHLYWSFKRFISHLLRKNTAHYITPSKEFFLILKGAFLYLFYRKA